MRTASETDSANNSHGSNTGRKVKKLINECGKMRGREIWTSVESRD